MHGPVCGADLTLVISPVSIDCKTCTHLTRD